ncbi:glyoxalase [Chitinophaga caeni]|uniref:Glyoxalase n=1 Tax=Chitinophaga caeni TaxID=2029983 RepID=A0A291QVM4_9BACT|nr:VOC family protein [Chitinophaga caeni]ATL48018.1 glyoxalase [Chitinophaga caeni]
MKIPSTHQSLMAYLIVPDAKQFFNFCQKVFGAEKTYELLREGTDTIQHAELQINGITIMFANAIEQWPPETGSFFIYVDDADKTYKVALENGASSILDLSTKDYGRTCGVKDPSGNTWWITSLPGK